MEFTLNLIFQNVCRTYDEFRVSLKLITVNMLIKINNGREPYFNTVLYDWRFVKVLLLDVFGLERLIQQTDLHSLQLNFVRGNYPKRAVGY